MKIKKVDEKFFTDNQGWESETCTQGSAFTKHLKYDIIIHLFFMGNGKWQMQYQKDCYKNFGKREGYATANEAYLDALEDCIKNNL